MGWLSLCVNLIRLRDAQLAGKTLFLGLFVRMFLKAISIRFYRLSKEDSHSLVINPIYWDPDRTNRQTEGEFSPPVFLSWDLYLLPPSDIGAPGSQAFGLGLIITLAFLIFRLAEDRLWGFSASVTT